MMMITGAKGPAGRVPSSFGDHGDQVYICPLQLLQVTAVFALGSVRSLTNPAPNLLATFKGGEKRSREGNG